MLGVAAFTPASIDPETFERLLTHSGASMLHHTLYMTNPDMAMELLSHGCWCSRLDSETTKVTGGNPIDEVDDICRSWFKMRRCNENNFCTEAPSDTYTININECTDSDECSQSSCNIDLDFANQLILYFATTPEWAPITDGECALRQGTDSNCDNYSPYDYITAPTEAPEVVCDNIDDLMMFSGIFTVWMRQMTIIFEITPNPDCHSATVNIYLDAANMDEVAASVIVTMQGMYEFSGGNFIQLTATDVSNTINGRSMPSGRAMVGLGVFTEEGFEMILDTDTGKVYVNGVEATRLSDSSPTLGPHLGQEYSTY